MSEKKRLLSVPSPYDLSGIKQASKRPDFLRMLAMSYEVGVIKKETSDKQKPRKKK
jgi:hypothetical protein